MQDKNYRFATEIEQPTDCVTCQRQFDEHGPDLVILCDGWEDGTPSGKIFISPAGIRIELHEPEQKFPVTVTRTTVGTA